MQDLLAALTGFLFGSGGAILLQRYLSRRQVEADIVQRYQEVVDRLWRRIDELQARTQALAEKIEELETEVEQLRRLVQAYERKFGRRFVIRNGKIEEIA